MAIEWTNGRVTAAVMAGCLVSGFIGAEWQRLLTSGGTPEAQVRAFQEGFDEGRKSAQSEIAEAYENGLDDGQASAPDPPPFDYPDNYGSVYYANCSAAEAAGAAPVYVGQPGYGRHLDRDGDGVGCE